MKRSPFPAHSLEPLESRIAPATFTVTTTADSGPGSLRQAILDANLIVPIEIPIIAFAIPDSGVQTIALLSPLPALARFIMLDGRTQHDYAGMPLIALNGSSAGAGVDGLVLGRGEAVYGLDIYGFSGNGVRVNDVDSIVNSCWIGLDETGSIAKGNGGSGVYLPSLTGSYSGGSLSRSVGSNVIAGNGRYGIEAYGEQGTSLYHSSVDIGGNRIGTNAAGDAAIGNALGGIYLSGGSAGVGGNLVSGNGGPGMAIFTNNKQYSSISGNIVGLNADGTAALPNLGDGIQAGMFLTANSVGGVPYLGGLTIGGTGTSRNVVSGNTGAGLNIGLNVTATGNYIGLNAAGTSAIGNGGAGMIAGGDYDFITGNIISANGGDGIRLSGVQTSIDGNWIGTDAAGSLALGNVGAGIRVTNGGPGYGGDGFWTVQPNSVTKNLIAYNGQDGIAVVQTGKAYLVQNTLLANAGLGIHLTDQGNLLLASPVLSGVTPGAGGTTIVGTYDDAPNSTRILHFYANSSPGAEAEIYLGTATIMTNGAGHADFTVSVPGTVISGQTVVATASSDTTSAGRTPIRTAYTSQLSPSAPVVAGLLIGDVSIPEGNSGTKIASFPVTLSEPSTSVVTVHYSTASGTAAAGSDYVATSGILTFAPGETSKSIEVVINGDTVSEYNESFHVLLSDASGAPLVDGDGLGTIINDDAPPPPLVSIGDVTITEGDTGTKIASFSVTLDVATSISASVLYRTADGSALAGSDYIAASGTLNFAPGETSKTVSVTIDGDTSFEADETFHVLLSAPNGLTIVDGDGLGTITNDDTPPQPVVSIGDVTITEGNSGTKTASFSVTLNAASSISASVLYQTADGTALAGSDYVATSGTLTFAPGEIGKTVSVTINGDTSSESDETFHVLLSNSSGLAIGDGDGLGTITNDDSFPHASINDVVVAEGNEGTTLAVFTVSLDAPSSVTSSVRFATYDDTAVSGVDFVYTSGELFFAPGETSKTIGVPVIGDSYVESDKTFSVHIGRESNMTVVDDTGICTILNDDVPPQISIDNVTLTEGDTGTKTATFSVSLDSARVYAASVFYQTADGTATAGGDYVATSGTLTFNPGETSQTVSVTIKGDTVPEPDEMFHVLLSSPWNATIANGDGLGTILNDEGPPPPIGVAPDHRTAIWGDVDGDVVMLKASMPILNSEQFHCSYDNLGLRIDRLDLSGVGGAATGVNLTFTVFHGPGGDGRFNLGQLDATGLDLGKVRLPGDLGWISAGQANNSTPGIAKLSVLSLGAMHAVSGDAGSSISDIMGDVRSLIVKGDLADAAVRVHDGSLKSASIGRILSTDQGGPTGLYADGFLGTINVYGPIDGHDNAHPVELFGAALPGIKNVHVYGAVQFADIAAGLDATRGGVNGSARINTLKVGGSLVASNVTAGIDPGADGLFGTADDSRLPLTSALISRISRITIAGSIQGTPWDDTDIFGIEAQEVGVLSLGGIKQHLLVRHIDRLSFGTTGDVTLREFE